ncbi:unnamed protein product, partial [Onchocerca ochengi]|uniref:TLC domain-containing protein n=1 Tax=Onchocerca ochengi TaxID=42157 RepID=A0A182EXS2_ONCOC
MLNLYRVNKSSTPFRIIALLNIVTFIIFRMVVSIYLLYWQITTKRKRGVPASPVQVITQAAGETNDEFHDEDEIE